MLKKSSVSSAVAAGITPLSQAPGAMLHWGSGSDVSRDALPSPWSTPMPPSTFQAKGPPAVPHRVRPYWTTGAIGLAPGVCPQAIAWEQEAAGMAFDLHPVLLTDTAHEVIPRATGELVWGHWQETAESCTPAVHPVLLIHAPDESRAVDHVTMVPSLPASDPLLQHMALVLQAVLAAEAEGGQLYAESLTNALVVHFLRRYAAARPSLRVGSGGLSPYKLRRTIAYIQAHLAQELSLVTLATVAQMSPTHFARLFKHATGLTPHQYVIRCRIEHAQRLVAETDLPLSEIAFRIGCADQSHFTALFRTHVALTPQAYRNHIRRV